MKIALLQTNVYEDKKRNLEEARELAAKAADEEAEICILPEMFSCPYDNRFFNVGCAAARDEKSTYVSYANSIICDPWGKVLACAGCDRNVLVSEISFDEIRKAREQLPIMREYLSE